MEEMNTSELLMQQAKEARTREIIDIVKDVKHNGGSVDEILDKIKMLLP